MPNAMKQKDPRAVKRRIYFTCVDTTALSTRLQSSDMSTFTCYLSKNGATAATTTNAPTQIDATNQKGLFYLELTATEIDTIGSVAIKITNTGGTKTMEPREFEIEIHQAYFTTAVAGTLTQTTFTSDRTETTDDFWKDCLIVALTGTNLGQVKKVGGYVGSSKTFVLASGLTLTNVVVNGDIFEILDR